MAVQLVVHWTGTREAGAPAYAALLYPVVAAIFAAAVLVLFVLLFRNSVRTTRDPVLTQTRPDEVRT